MVGDPIIETTIYEGDTLNDFDFIINAFNGSPGSAKHHSPLLGNGPLLYGAVKIF